MSNNDLKHIISKLKLICFHPLNLLHLTPLSFLLIALHRALHHSSCSGKYGGVTSEFSLSLTSHSVCQEIPVEFIIKIYPEFDYILPPPLQPSSSEPPSSLDFYYVFLILVRTPYNLFSIE